MFTCVRFLFWQPFFIVISFLFLCIVLLSRRFEMQYDVELSMQLCQQLPEKVFV